MQGAKSGLRSLDIEQPEPSELPRGAISSPWAQCPDEVAPEELECPDPLAFGEDVLRFMELSIQEARKEYLDLLPSRISPEMLSAVPQVLEFLRGPESESVFTPSAWEGIKVPAATFNVRGDLPKRLKPKARPVRPALYDNAKKEFERLRTYFYVESDSPHASPLVIAPKATAPFIRFCGDYRVINDFIEIPQQPIPIVKHELIKAAGFKVYVDLDMANSFHQIPLSEDFSNLLSVQTPWGLYRPKFLPEGVGPASGLLQHIVRDLFRDFSEWTIVIFDNFLVLADSYMDAYDKLQKIIMRCCEKGLVLKLKKSWFGVKSVTFFGYEVFDGVWRLSQARKDAIQAMTMPKNAKQMQSFLGAALFFHHHIPNYADWAAKLYDTTKSTFDWERPETWREDYVFLFETFKRVVTDATELYFPDYSLPWFIRADASRVGVGSVLFQVAHLPNGDVINQPIAFSSHKFSGSALNWDVYKKEAYGLFKAVQSNEYYVRGKAFILQTDHNNLLWIEASTSPIVVRWRVYLQSFDFMLQHVVGKANKVADWRSRDPSFFSCAGLLGADNDSNDDDNVFDKILRSVHGGRKLHFGAAETWRRAKLAFPQARLSIDAVRKWVKECPMCQKQRATGIEGLPSVVLHLKPDTYRRTVGVDHVAVTPADSAGNQCAIMVVEHFSHFPQAYAAADYSAETLAKALFKHFCTFGVFDELASDPGSAMMSEAVARLNGWLGIAHKVSLVGRHESNGCEGSIKQFLRHLSTLVLEERLVNAWSSDTVLPLINFALASFPTSETGGYSPFQLKYGTQDATYFRLPHDLSPGERSHALVALLDSNLRTVREASRKLMQQIIAERSRANPPVQAMYESGDLVLWNPQEHAHSMLPEKLAPRWLGPYEVIRQVKNDVDCIHVNLATRATFHVDRLKPFFGSREDAIAMARLDKNQVFIVSINFFKGNPHLRTSMEFNITFEDGTISMPYGSDLADSQQFIDYVLDTPYLFPLRFSAKEAQRQAAKLSRLTITNVSVGSAGYLNLRYFDGTSSAWFDSLQLPFPHLAWVVDFRYLEWANAKQTRIKIHCAVFNSAYILSAYDILTLVFADFDPSRMMLVTHELCQRHQISFKRFAFQA
jgi:hypothetical protein